MPKELVLSIVFLGMFLLAFLWGLFDIEILKEPVYLAVAVACLIGHVVTAHLAYNQFKNVTETETFNEDEEDDGKEKGNEFGFDD